MVAPDSLRTLCTLDDEDAFEPSVGETGEIQYPTVDEHLGERDREAFLETMTDRGVLASTFEHKVYICPHCATEGMQYSTGCPDCGSVHAITEDVAIHEPCGSRLGAIDSVDSGDEDADPGVDDGSTDDSDSESIDSCPGCEDPVSAASIERDRQYHCHDCEAWFDEPVHRLWCRSCSRVYPPADVREEPLVRYPVTGFGRRWIDEQVQRRELLAEAFETRGYETTIDTTVETDAGETIPVHVYAVDELLDARIVAGVHDSPTASDVTRLATAARTADARAVLLLTDGAVGERISELCAAESVTVVSAADGLLSREYETTDQSTPNPIADWLQSMFSPSNSNQ